MLQGAGITSNHRRLLLNGMQNVVSFGGAVFGAIYTDKWGRRPQLLVSTGICVGIFCIVCALVATNVVNGPDGKPKVDDTGTPLIKSSSQAKAVIAFIFIFGFIFSAGYTPLQQLYPVECLRYESRAKGMAFYNFWVNIAGFYNTFVTGIAFSGAGWKVRLGISLLRTLSSEGFCTNLCGSIISSSSSGTCSSSPSSISSTLRRGVAPSRSCLRSLERRSRLRRVLARHRSSCMEARV